MWCLVKEICLLLWYKNRPPLLHPLSPHPIPRGLRLLPLGLGAGSSTDWFLT